MPCWRTASRLRPPRPALLRSPQPRTRTRCNLWEAEGAAAKEEASNEQASRLTPGPTCRPRSKMNELLRATTRRRRLCRRGRNSACGAADAFFYCSPKTSSPGCVRDHALRLSGAVVAPQPLQLQTLRRTRWWNSGGRCLQIVRRAGYHQYHRCLNMRWARSATSASWSG